MLRRSVLGFAVLLLLGLGAFACSDECKVGTDCVVGEYCLQGVCTQVNAGYLSCVSNSDCKVNGVSSPLFECLAGRCSPVPFVSTSTLTPDAGRPD